MNKYLKQNFSILRLVFLKLFQFTYHDFSWQNCVAEHIKSDLTNKLILRIPFERTFSPDFILTKQLKDLGGP